MERFATRADLVALHPDLDAVGDERADAVLGMVSAAIASLCDASGVDADVLRLVCCNAAARSLQSGDGAGVQSASWGASPFSGSVTYANPAGDVYLTAFERRLLGIDGADMEAGFCCPEPAAWSE